MKVRSMWFALWESGYGIEKLRKVKWRQKWHDGGTGSKKERVMDGRGKKLKEW